jgi:hypothetical protein
VDRYYDPVTDQFLTVDPDLAETGQAYAFTGDDPLNKTDPLGLKGGGGNLAALECRGLHGKSLSKCQTKSHKIQCHCTPHSGSPLLHALAKTSTWVVKHPGDIATGIGIGLCITASVGVCGAATAVAFVARVAQRHEEGSSVLSASNGIDLLTTATSFGLLGGSSSLAEDAFEDNPLGLGLFRVHSALPDIFGWTTGELTHQDVP